MPQMKSFFDLVNELSMKSDKKLPNLKVPVKGKKGVSKFSRKKAIGQAKDDLNAGFKTDANRKAAFAKMNDAVQSADRKPEKYLKPDGKVGVRMVKTDKEVIKKEQMQVFRIGHKTMGGNVHAKDPQSAMTQLRKKGVKGDIKLTHRGSVKSMPKAKKVEQTEASVLKPTKPTDIIKHAKTLAKNPRDYMMNKKKYLDKARAKVFRMYPREAINHDDAHRDAQTHSDGSMSVKKIPSMIKKPGDKHLHLHMKSYHKEKDGQDFAKKHGYKVKNFVKTQSGTRMDLHKEEVEVDVDEALTLQQRMKRSRMMRRMRTRIKVGRERAKRKMANKEKLEKRARRQARNMIAKKLTRGIPKAELTFARKKEIEKRLDKPVLQARIKRIAKRIFKDVRKKEVQRKKG